MNTLLELKKQIIASVVSNTILPGPEVTFLRAQLLGERSSRTSGEINAAYTVGSVGHWPVWDVRPELGILESEFFALRGKGPVSPSELSRLAFKFDVKFPAVLTLASVVEANLTRFAEEADFVPVVAMVPRERGHFLFEESGKLIDGFTPAELPSFSVNDSNTDVDRWDWVTRFGVVVPDVVASIIKDSTIVCRVGDSLSDDDVADWLDSDVARFNVEMSASENFDFAVSKEWGTAETELLDWFQVFVAEPAVIRYSFH